MKDRLIFEKQQTLTNNFNALDWNELNKQKIYDSVGPNPRSSLSEIVEWAQEITKKTTELRDDNLVLFDSSMQVDGVFFAFCKENNYTITNILIDALSVLSYSDENFDPFAAHGLFKIDIDKEFSFIKSSLLYQPSQNSDSSSAFSLVPKKYYDKYVELKSKFIDWLRQSEGVLIKVVGGEDYLQDVNYKWDDLFFGEKETLKEDLKATIDNFYASRDYYYENNIPWHLTLFVEGGSGFGKTTLINTLISEYMTDPTTVNYFNTDNSVLNVFLKSTESNTKNLVFIDNLDDYMDQEFITPDYFYDMIDNYKGNDGNVLVFCFKKIPDYFKDLQYSIDKIITIGNPEHTNSLTYLFGEYLTTANIKELQKTCIANDISYGYLYKLYRLFMKKMLNTKKATKKKDALNELTSILTSILKEDDKLIKTKSKKIGLLGKK